MREQRQLLRNAIDTQPFDESQVRYQAQELSKLQAEWMVARAALMNQVSGVLTQEQRAKWNELRAQRNQQFKDRFERRRANPEQQRG